MFEEADIRSGGRAARNFSATSRPGPGSGKTRLEILVAEGTHDAEEIGRRVENNDVRQPDAVKRLQ